MIRPNIFTIQLMTAPFERYVSFYKLSVIMKLDHEINPLTAKRVGEGVVVEQQSCKLSG